MKSTESRATLGSTLACAVTVYDAYEEKQDQDLSLVFVRPELQTKKILSSCNAYVYIVASMNH